MPSLIWNSGASISCTQTVNRFDITLNGSAYLDGAPSGHTVSYRLYVNGESQWNLNNDKTTTYYIAWLPAGATQFTIQIEARSTYAGTTYTAMGPSKVQQVTNYVTWDSGTYFKVYRDPSNTEYVRTQLVGGAHTINGGSGEIRYIWNIYLDPTASTPSAQYRYSEGEKTADFSIVDILGGYDHTIAISVTGQLTYNGIWFYTTELPKVTYFTYSGKTVKRYNGSAWQNCEVFYYVGNGTGNYGTNNNWQRVQPMVYNGTSFVQNIYE
jgi:hypothetical protein